MHNPRMISIRETGGNFSPNSESNYMTVPCMLRRMRYSLINERVSCSVANISNTKINLMETEPDPRVLYKEIS
jgi:hypothetical protein